MTATLLKLPEKELLSEDEREWQLAVQWGIPIQKAADEWMQKRRR